MKLLLGLSLVSALSLGCDQKKPSSDTPATKPSAVETKKEKGPTGTPRPQSKLTVTLDGKPVPMIAALAWKSWDGTIQITASSVAVGCSDVTGDMRSIQDGEVTFDVFAAQSLQADGSLKGEQRSTYFSGMNDQVAKAATLTGDGSPDKPTTIDVDFETSSPGEKKRTLVVKGTIDAIGCVAPAKAVPPLPAPMGANIEVAGKKLPVRFARWSSHSDTRSLELLTGAEACKDVPFSPPSELKVRFTWFKAGDPQVNQIDLGGALVSNKADQTFDKKKVTFTPPPAGPGDTEIHADAKIMGYPLKVDGKVTVTECPKE